MSTSEKSPGKLIAFPKPAQTAKAQSPEHTARNHVLGRLGVTREQYNAVVIRVFEKGQRTAQVASSLKLSHVQIHNVIVDAYWRRGEGPARRAA
jgi:hypothetical protein